MVSGVLPIPVRFNNASEVPRLGVGFRSLASILEEFGHNICHSLVPPTCND
jgi:hypothetical protein